MSILLWTGFSFQSLINLCVSDALMNLCVSDALMNLCASDALMNLCASDALMNFCASDALMNLCVSDALWICVCLMLLWICVRLMYLWIFVRLMHLWICVCPVHLWICVCLMHLWICVCLMHLWICVSLMHFEFVCVWCILNFCVSDVFWRSVLHIALLPNLANKHFSWDFLQPVVAMNEWCCYYLLMLCVIPVPSIKAIDNRMWNQCGFIKEKQNNNQYKLRSFNNW